jgi:holin-like protein
MDRQVRWNVKMIDSAIKLLLFQALAEALVFALAIPVPAPVVGMLLLFLYLALRGREDEKLNAFSTKFLRHLTLLFIPAAVGMMLHLDRVANEWLPILVALTGSTLVSIGVTAFVVRTFRNGR